MSFLGGLVAEQRDVYARSSNPPPFINIENILYMALYICEFLFQG